MTSMPAAFSAAMAVVSEAGKVSEAAIDLSAGRMTGWQPVTGEPACLQYM